MGKTREACSPLPGQGNGYRRLTAQLRCEGFAVNRKRVRRLMTEAGIQGTATVRCKRTTNSDHAFPRSPNLVEVLGGVQPEQGGVVDLSSIRLGTEFIYLAVVTNVLTRAIRGWQLLAKGGSGKCCAGQSEGPASAIHRCSRQDAGIACRRTEMASADAGQSGQPVLEP
ncbi:MAG: IS3 family transposase [Planctomycetes bacterium]|nr:IS3 family transposase [Planctomycetota bacterium]